jgi:hypothetical protein
MMSSPCETVPACDVVRHRDLRERHRAGDQSPEQGESQQDADGDEVDGSPPITPDLPFASGHTPNPPFVWRRDRVRHGFRSKLTCSEGV